jgi:hypothetical protein
MIKADLKCEEKASSILNLESFTVERAHGPKLPVGFLYLMNTFFRNTILIHLLPALGHRE